MKKTYLYVILLPQMDEELRLGYMIKFGYSKDFEDRMKMGYNAYHRFVKVLYLYEGDFTREDESKVKQYFRESDLVLFGDEYMKYCPEVLEFFNTYNTSEKLKNKINTIPYKLKNNKYYKVNYNYIEYIISRIYPDLTELLDLQDKRDEIYKILRNYKEREQYTYIKAEYGITEDELKSYITNIISNPTPKACELACEFNELGDSCKKLTMLVNLKTLDGITEHDINSFLELIQPKYKEYYVVMGPEFIKANKCHEADIKREWKKKLSNETVDVNSEILKIFKPGDRYSKSDIKSILGDLYEKLGYHKTAKATDLEALFTLKLVKVVEKDGKKSNGFELLEKR